MSLRFLSHFASEINITENGIECEHIEQNSYGI